MAPLDYSMEAELYSGFARACSAEGSDLLYRIKSADETFERVAKEHELTRRSE